jgi:ParB family transcriptional regulator, chromosome partitioning protein
VRSISTSRRLAGGRPTVDNYLGRVTKTRILEAVREAKGEGAVQLIDHLKKSEMAKEAERSCGLLALAAIWRHSSASRRN